MEFFRRRWVPIRVENIFDADEKEDPILEGQLISTARSIRVGVGALRVEQPYLNRIYKRRTRLQKRPARPTAGGMGRFCTGRKITIGTLLVGEVYRAYW